MAEQDPLEVLINQIVDAEPVLEDPELDTQLLSAFTTDIAENIHDPKEIAKRYGFATGERMVDWMNRNRGVVKMIAAKRAAFNANQNIESVNRKKANFILGEAMPDMAKVMFDPRAPASVRLDTFKAFSRVAGVDGLPAAAAIGGKDAGGNGFTVNFLFSGQPTQTITTVVDVAPERQETTPLMPDLGPPPEWVKPSGLAAEQP